MSESESLDHQMPPPTYAEKYPTGETVTADKFSIQNTTTSDKYESSVIGACLMIGFPFPITYLHAVLVRPTYATKYSS